MFPGFLFCFVSIWEGIIATLTHDFFPKKTMYSMTSSHILKALKLKIFPENRALGAKLLREG